MNWAIDDISSAGGGGAPAPAGSNKGPVLIVDDDPTDSMLAEDVLAELQPKFPVQILTSGPDLLAYLEGEGLYADRAHYALPSLVLLDLKMPGMDGFAVLEWLKQHPKYSSIPIVALSGFSDMAAQVTKAYQLGARSFLPKPVQLQDIQGILSILKISI